jgi:hypothetical protein
MKRQSGILWAVGLGIVWSLGCDKAAPTEPARDLADMSIAEVAPSPADLSGTWSGTITFHAFESDTEVLLCDGRAPISVTLNQDGSSLTGHFQNACAGMLEIRGQIAASSISGSLDSSTGFSYGSISGFASSHEIRFHTSKFVDKSRDETKGEEGQGFILTSEVDLRPRPVDLAARTHPRLVDGGRSPRAVRR